MPTRSQSIHANLGLQHIRHYIVHLYASLEINVCSLVAIVHVVQHTTITCPKVLGDVPASPKNTNDHQPAYV